MSFLVRKTADVKTKLWYSIKDFYVACPVLVKIGICFLILNILMLSAYRQFSVQQLGSFGCIDMSNKCKLCICNICTKQTTGLFFVCGSSSSSVGPVANATCTAAYRLIVLTLYPPPSACLDVPTFVTRYPHVHDARDPSSERWTCVGED